MNDGYIALRRDLILLSLLGTHGLYRSIRPELCHDGCLPLNKHVQELGERILPDPYHGQLIALVESRTEDSRCNAHVLLLKLSCLLCLAIGRLENGLKDRID